MAFTEYQIFKCLEHSYNAAKIMDIAHLDNSNIKVALALGSGSARGWAHIGIVQALVGNGIVPDIICGCSIGSVIGASYAGGKLAKLEAWAKSLSRFEIAKYIELSSYSKGFVNKKRLHKFLNDFVGDDELLIEDLPKPFTTVATDMGTGREVWFSKGSLVKAVWASISVPGVFPPINYKNHWLADGALVNPVPVSVCRAMGADVVIGVNLNGNIIGKHCRKETFWREGDRVSETNSDNKGRKLFKKRAKEPGLFESIAGSINIVQDRITRSRLAGDPPDILLTPDVAQIGLMEFHRAEEAIDGGRASVEKELAHIKMASE